jgi:tRNA(fMet)-specific endonuclease VapC
LFPFCSRTISSLSRITQFSPGDHLAVSLITLAEVEYGMESKNWGASRRCLMGRFLARFTLLLPDGETARLWARIKTSRERQGRPIRFADAWIAAAAVQLNLPLVTHNARDYEAIERLVVVTVPMSRALT